MNATPKETTALLPCPFCGGAARIESNRDWHRLFAAHDDDCILDADESELMYPAQPGYLIQIATDWNRRTAPSIALSGSDAEQVRQIWESALADAALYVSAHCADGERHAETILAQPLPTITAPSIPAQPGSGEAVDLSDTLSAVLWLYHRLPRGYERQSHIERVISTLAVATECDAETLLSDLGRATPAPATTSRPATWQDRMTAHYAKGSVQCHGSEHFMALELAEWRGADSAAESIKQSRELWQDAISQAAFYVLNHCADGEYHAEAISTMPLPTFTSRGLDSASERDAARYAYVRCLHPCEFEKLVSANIAGKGKFDDLVDAAMQPKGK